MKDQRLILLVVRLILWVVRLVLPDRARIPDDRRRVLHPRASESCSDVAGGSSGIMVLFMSAPYRAIAKLPPSRSVPKYLTACRRIVGMMKGNTNVPDPPVPLADVTSHLDDLDACQVATLHGSKLSFTERNAALWLVECDMRQLKAYAQACADADYTQSELVIASTGMDVKKRPMWTKPPCAARYGVSGTLVLEVRSAGRRASYYWQMSTDESHWTDLPETVECQTTVTGLTPGGIYFFRWSTLTRRGRSAWSDAFRVIAH